MLAARIDQENAVHARQQAAAAKPLNQTVGGRVPPKTPGKIPLNDENEVDKFGKGTVGKGLGGKQLGGKAEKNLFQTPAPRERQALGFKTTNAKATAFQTPAPKTLGPSPSKTQRRTAGRSRLQIHKEVKEAEPEIDWANEEIQYIPPRPKPLPDVPSDDEWDKIDFSILKAGNLEGERLREAALRRKARDDAEFAKWDKEDQERMKRDNDEFMRTVMDGLQDPIYDDSDEEAVVPKKKAVPARQVNRQVGTLTSRSAASALSLPKKVPSYAAPTAATKAKVPTSSILGHKKTPSLSNTSAPTARASSYQTLGYAKGRAVSSTIHPSSSTSNDKAKPAKVKKRDPLRELEELIHARELEEAGITAADLEDFDVGGVSLDGEDEEEVFQMKIPEA